MINELNLSLKSELQKDASANRSYLEAEAAKIKTVQEYNHECNMQNFADLKSLFK